MGIKLSDFIKDPHNVFTQEEAEMIYLAAGYVDLGNEYPGYIEASIDIDQEEDFDFDNLFTLDSDNYNFNFSQTLCYNNDNSNLRFNSKSKGIKIKISQLKSNALEGAA